MIVRVVVGAMYRGWTVVLAVGRNGRGCGAGEGVMVGCVGDGDGACDGVADSVGNPDGDFIATVVVWRWWWCGFDWGVLVV